MGSGRGKVKAMRLMNKFISVVLALIFSIGFAFASPEFLSPEKAFKVKATWLLDTNNIELEIFPEKAITFIKNHCISKSAPRSIN